MAYEDIAVTVLSSSCVNEIQKSTVSTIRESHLDFNKKSRVHLHVKVWHADYISLPTTGTLTHKISNELGINDF